MSGIWNMSIWNVILHKKEGTGLIFSTVPFFFQGRPSAQLSCHVLRLDSESYFRCVFRLSSLVLRFFSGGGCTFSWYHHICEKKFVYSGNIMCIWPWPNWRCLLQCFMPSDWLIRLRYKETDLVFRRIHGSVLTRRHAQKHAHWTHIR